MQKTGIAQTSYTVIEPNTYLVVTPAPDAAVIEYCARMGESNQIPGLLPMHRQSVNGECLFYYNITGKKRLSDLARQTSVGKKQGEHLFATLLRSFAGLPEYFLRANLCLLDTEYLFVDERMDTYLPLFPLSSDPQQSGNGLKEFFLSLVGLCAARDNPDPYFARLLNQLIRPEFDLAQFTAVAMPQQAAPTPPVSAPVAAIHAPAPPVSTPAAPVAKQKKAPASPAAPGGFAVPGHGVAVPPAPKKADKPKKAKPEKGDLTVFGIHIGGKKKPAVPKLDMGKENHVVSAGNATPSVPTPAPSAPSIPQPSWQGTVGLPIDDGTAFMDEHEPTVPVLIHQKRRIAIAAVPFSLGKSGCQYAFESPKISRSHATILIENGHYCIRDENSTNHTYVNGVMIAPYTPHPLEHGMVLRLGDQELIFEWDGSF